MCRNISKTFNTASKHYIGQHKNTQYERETIESVTKVRRTLLEKIDNLKKEIIEGSNVAMAATRLNLIAMELSEQESLLENFEDDKFLPPTLHRKRQQMLLLLNDDIRSLRCFIKQM